MHVHPHQSRKSACPNWPRWSVSHSLLLRIVEGKTIDLFQRLNKTSGRGEGNRERGTWWNNVNVGSRENENEINRVPV